MLAVHCLLQQHSNMMLRKVWARELPLYKSKGEVHPDRHVVTFVMGQINVLLQPGSKLLDSHFISDL